MMHNSPSYHANTAVIQVMIGTVNIALLLVDSYTESCIIMAYTAALGETLPGCKKKILERYFSTMVDTTPEA
jgi:hypothetical protein